MAKMAMQSEMTKNANRSIPEQWKLPWYDILNADETPFEIVGTETLPTTDKSYDTVDALTNQVIIVLPYGVDKFESRCLVPADGNQAEFALWGARGGSKRKDHFAHIATLVWTGGTQAFNSNWVFCDTLAISDNTDTWAGTLVKSCDAVDSSIANNIVRLHFSSLGYNTFAFICHTLLTDKARIQFSGFNEG